jgi:DNA polymerase III delta prime subunit
MVISRTRKHKTGYSVGVTPYFVKVELGKKVWYLPRFNMFSNPFWRLTAIRDNEGEEIVSHVRKRSRVTIERRKMMLLIEAFLEARKRLVATRYIAYLSTKQLMDERAKQDTVALAA